MQFDSKSVALKDRNKRQVDVGINNEAVGVTQQVKEISIRCSNHLPKTLGALCLLAATDLPAFGAVVDGPGGGPRANNGLVVTYSRPQLPPEPAFLSVTLGRRRRKPILVWSAPNKS
jgi:hypothetical protein